MVSIDQGGKQSCKYAYRILAVHHKVGCMICPSGKLNRCPRIAVGRSHSRSGMIGEDQDRHMEGMDLDDMDYQVEEGKMFVRIVHSGFSKSQSIRHCVFVYIHVARMRTVSGATTELSARVWCKVSIKFGFVDLATKTMIFLWNRHLGVLASWTPPSRIVIIGSYCIVYFRSMVSINVIPHHR